MATTCVICGSALHEFSVELCQEHWRERIDAHDDSTYGEWVIAKWRMHNRDTGPALRVDNGGSDQC